jgi:hypothetical protein
MDALRMIARTWLTVAALGLGLLTACTQDFDAFNPDDSLATAASGSTTTGTGGSGGVPITSSSGPSGGSGSTTGPGSGGAASSSMASSSVASGGTGGSGGGPGQPVLHCDNDATTCAPGEVCCIEDGGSNQSCKPQGSCAGNENPVSCDDASDCPGATCCYHKTGGGSLDENFAISCEQNCNGIVICESDAECDGSSCTPSPFFAGMSYCPP